jgi:hypothetical protein
MATDPLQDYYQSLIGAPAGFVGAMENLGFQGTPFGSQQQGFADIENFQRSLKSILDKQLGGFGNTNLMPFNLRNFFTAAAPIYQDPLWSILGTPDFFKGGFRTGALPQEHTGAFRQFIDRTTAPPPPKLGPTQVIKPADIGMHMGIDESGNTIQINKAYADMSAQEKDAANRYGRQYPSGQ